MTYTRRRCSEKGDRRLTNGKIGEKIKPIKILGEEEAAAHIPLEGKNAEDTADKSAQEPNSVEAGNSV